MSEAAAEHHCDGIWIDLDEVLEAAGEEAIAGAARAAAGAGAVGVIGGFEALACVDDDGDLGTLARGAPEQCPAHDLLLVEHPESCSDAARWCARTGGQLVLSPSVIESVSGAPEKGPWADDAVAGVWCNDPESDHLELARSEEAWAGFHAGLEFATAFRSGAGALAGPLPLLSPALAVALADLCADGVERALEIERRISRWIETALLQRARAAGLERYELSSAALEVGGWIPLLSPRMRDDAEILRHQLADLAGSVGLDEDLVIPPGSL